MRGNGAALVVGVLLIAGGCTEPKDAYSRIQSPPTKLLGNYLSYSAPQPVVSTFKATGQPFEVVEHVKLGPEDRRPSYDLYEIELPGQEFCGDRGALKLTFFNDRLMSTTFYPANPKECLARLPYLEIRTGKGEAVEGNTLIAANIDYRDRAYISWSDRRIVEELDKWVMRYS
jgi:hypothetical protein